MSTRKTARTYLNIFLVCAAFWMALPAAAADDDEERIRALEREVAELNAAIAELRAMGLAEDRLTEVERRLALLAEEVEDLKLAEAAPEMVLAEGGEPYGLGPAAAKVYSKDHGVSIGGYGDRLHRRAGADHRCGRLCR